MFVSIPVRRSLLATKALKDDSIMIGDRELPIEIILLNLKDFGIIVRMDWLATYHALVDCFNKKTNFKF